MTLSTDLEFLRVVYLHLIASLMLASDVHSEM